MMDEYVERVARVLDTEPALSDLPAVESFPRARTRRLSMPSIEMGMLDFLSLYGCELQQVVGEKTSIMGRVMQPLNRLRYEVRFILAARACVPLIDDDELIADLDKAIVSKLSSLPIAVWNATWAVEEAESLVTLAKGRLPVKENNHNGRVLAADLNRLAATVAALRVGDLDQDLDYVGAVHQRWLANHTVGQLVNSARLLIARLSDATALIHGRINGRPLCFDGKTNAQADIVQSMFASVYVGEVQPYMAAVGRQRDAIMGPLAQLAARQTDVMPDDFKAYYRNILSTHDDNSLWQQLDRSMARHTKAWQTLLEQCGLRPSP